MRDSDTYMAILDEGWEKGLMEGSLAEAKKMILKFGQKSLGAPAAGVRRRTFSRSEKGAYLRRYEAIRTAG